MDRKSLSRVEVKDADKGEVVAVFATLNVVDHDGDVTLPGAFEDGAAVRVSAYGHTSWTGALPVGKGTIREVGDEAVADLQFFLGTSGGRDTFAVVKELGDLQEWSYGYDAIEESYGEQDGQKVRFLRKLLTHEVSPVLMGAGVGTRTLAAKSGMKFAAHVESVLADIEALAARASEVMALRASKGKAISDVSADLLGRMAAAVKRLDELLAAPPDTDDGAARDIAARELARYVALTQGA